MNVGKLFGILIDDLQGKPIIYIFVDSCARIYFVYVEEGERKFQFYKDGANSLAFFLLKFERNK